MRAPTLPVTPTVCMPDGRCWWCARRSLQLFCVPDPDGTWYVVPVCGSCLGQVRWIDAHAGARAVVFRARREETLP